jgi:DNA-binding SARP family transcriptional activator
LPLTLTIWCLNGFRVQRGPEFILPESWNRKKTALLFKFLLVHRQLVPVHVLLNEFWSHLPEKSARHNLAVTVYNLRRVLEPELERGQRSNYILGGSDYLYLNWDLVAFYDVDEFLKRYNQGMDLLAQGLLRPAARALTDALEFYKTDFLLDAASEPWIIAERERLQVARLDLLEHLSEILIKLGQYKKAFEHARHLVQLDPCNEEGHRMVIEALARLGHRSQAIAQYQRCREVLKRERGIEPGPLTEELYRRIASGESCQGSPR